MLILYLSSLSRKYSSEQLDKYQAIKSVYINYEPQFPELVNFIDESKSRYSLELVSLTMKLKDGLATYLSQNKEIKAIIVGTRKSDPYSSELQHFQRTDHGWPDFMRIHPVINWHYDEIWCFLKTLGVEYCKLYDQGFTSLGGVDTTIRNPSLKQNNGQYLPAFKLKGDDRERDGRDLDTIKNELKEK